jgi:hypothetical protein
VLKASLLYLKHSFKLSDEELAQIGRFRPDLGEDAQELLLKATIETAVGIQTVQQCSLPQGHNSLPAQCTGQL